MSTDHTPRSSAFRRLADAFARFDIVAALQHSAQRASGVDGEVPADPNERLPQDVVAASKRELLRHPWKIFGDHVLRWYAIAVLVFSTVIGGLLVTGRLGDFYRRIYTFWPGRPWTHVMRDHPWIYALLAIALLVVPYWLAPKGRWGRSFLTYVVFLVGFLGGHVLWGGGTVNL